MKERAPATGERAREALRRWFGYPDFRPGQADAVAAVLSGRDTFVLLPTGGGKSLCYQVPALLLPGTTVVVSPLISLMKDQVDALRRRGIAAAFVNSQLGRREAGETLDDFRRGRLRLLYLAPERFRVRRFRRALEEARVSLLAIDEAHCVSEWGHDFRPDYLGLGEIRAALACPAVALTATATPRVRREVAGLLRLRAPLFVVGSFDRPNLRWEVRRTRREERDRRLVRAVREEPGAAIVFAPTRRTTEGIRDGLRRRGVGAERYHAGLGDGERKRVQDAFMAGDLRVVVATNAFGMGVDKPDVRLVLHHRVPRGPEAYYQEAGRAGRDGEPARCLLLHAPGDLEAVRRLTAANHPPPEVVAAVHAAVATRIAAGRPAALDPEAVAGAAGCPPPAVAAALRALEGAGALRREAGTAGHLGVRVLASGDRVRRELGAGGREEELLVVERIRTLEAARRPTGTVAPGAVPARWRELAPAGGDLASLRETLRRLAREGFVAWEERGGGTLHRLLVRPGELPPDHGARLLRRRLAEERRLRAMEAYVRTRECRRALLLSYFGEAGGAAPCGGCDNCRRGRPRGSRRRRDPGA